MVHKRVERETKRPGQHSTNHGDGSNTGSGAPLTGFATLSPHAGRGSTTEDSILNRTANKKPACSCLPAGFAPSPHVGCGGHREGSLPRLHAAPKRYRAVQYRRVKGLLPGEPRSGHDGWKAIAVHRHPAWRRVHLSRPCTPSGAVAQDLPRGVAAQQSGHATPGWLPDPHTEYSRAGRHGNCLPQQRTSGEHLVEAERAVEDVAADQSKRRSGHGDSS